MRRKLEVVGECDGKEIVRNDFGRTVAVIPYIFNRTSILLMTLDDRYLPTAIVFPFEGHARQSKLMHAQVNVAQEKYMELWIRIIKQKISNQSRALSILGLDGAERIAEYVATVGKENVDYCESLAAKEYFSYYHEGFNRRRQSIQGFESFYIKMVICELHRKCICG